MIVLERPENVKPDLIRIKKRRRKASIFFTSSESSFPLKNTAK